ncbi:Alcohol dehydrogenase zinc-binding domain protein [Desulfofarcimen acetoxidans DSM 771]|jgi:L-iditol 2-dehydrogenase|uniref:Alcohol dehydrogenase zinc-binding domain protein n=1 Tax=Desulfofarcimen acetoxidans (strain ATCC 49208 / DSM 771 / KCTC 5769 / VKM B-1644 / 5575) TaxID=485916 RepID=C8W1P7_DESAS|nr:zinc-dependent dehydrogenase [Desulfofarcimen acetoxidans]ACV63518.1 Alcohol dehydrogenase zinc-binding domain protein [Desulfofarcimen acetoxidans DSM 771]
MMKAAVVYGKDDIRIEMTPKPSAGEGDLVVKVRSCGICATDVKILLGNGLPKDLPTILGHEVAGEIAEIGQGVDGFTAGQRVAVYPIAVCGECEFCRRDNHNLCLKEFGLSHGIDGGFAEYVRIPYQIVKAGGVVIIPDHLSFEEAAMAEPLSCCLAAARSGPVGPGCTVAIIGAGPMGLLHLKVAKQAGAKVIVADLLEQRLNQAKEMGADFTINTSHEDFVQSARQLTGGLGADMVIASLGIPQIMQDYLPAVKNGGTFNIFGGPPAGQSMTVDPRWLHYGEIKITGTFASTPQDFQRAVELIASGEIAVKDMISHRFSLDNLLEAVEKVKNREMIRGVLSI